MRGAPRSRGASGRSRARTRAAGATSSTSSAPCTRPGAPPRRRCARSSSASAPTPWSSSSIRSGWTSPWRTRWWPPEGRSTARTCSRARPLRSGSARWSCSATPRRARCPSSRARDCSRRPRTSRTCLACGGRSSTWAGRSARAATCSPPRRTTKASVRETPTRRGSCVSPRRSPRTRGSSCPSAGPPRWPRWRSWPPRGRRSRRRRTSRRFRRSPRSPRASPSAWRPRPRTPSRPLSPRSWPAGPRRSCWRPGTRFWRPAPRAPPPSRRRWTAARCGAWRTRSTPTPPRRRRRRARSFRSFPRRFRSAREAPREEAPSRSRASPCAARSARARRGA